MTERADRGADTDDGWRARLGWAYGLIAGEAAERDAALAVLAGARIRVGEALSRFNALLVAARWDYEVPGVREAFAEYQRAAMYVLPDALWNRPRANIESWPGLPYALLFLEWEARYPEDWTAHAKKWGTKQFLIRELAVAEHTAPVRAKLTDLVEIVVRRPYRCKDRDYVRVARAVDSPGLRARLAAAARSGDPWARRHAGYVLWLLDHPELPNSLHVWHTWNAGGPERRSQSSRVWK